MSNYRVGDIVKVCQGRMSGAYKYLESRITYVTKVLSRGERLSIKILDPYDTSNEVTVSDHQVFRYTPKREDFLGIRRCIPVKSSIDSVSPLFRVQPITGGSAGGSKSGQLDIYADGVWLDSMYCVPILEDMSEDVVEFSDVEDIFERENEVREKAQEFINKIIYRFESETGLSVEDIRVEHFADGSKKSVIILE